MPKEDRNFVSRSELETEITQLMGGRVAEHLILKDISTGASNDLQRASQIARKMVTEYGMSDDLGPITYGSDQDEIFIGRDYGHTRMYSEDVASRIDEEIKKIIQEAYNKAEKLLKENINRLHKVAEALLEKEKLESEEFEAIFAAN